MSSSRFRIAMVLGVWSFFVFVLGLFFAHTYWPSRTCNWTTDYNPEWDYYNEIPT